MNPCHTARLGLGALVVGLMAYHLPNIIHGAVAALVGLGQGMGY